MSGEEAVVAGGRRPSRVSAPDCEEGVAFLGDRLRLLSELGVAGVRLKE